MSLLHHTENILEEERSFNRTFGFCSDIVVVDARLLLLNTTDIFVKTA
ncbi:hypothetical protein ACHAXS_002177 [Conticribra weissflogii]